MKQQSATSTYALLRRYAPLMRELVLRDLRVRYRRSILGYFWSLLNPLLMMCVMAFVFSTFFNSTVENFPLYLICGQTMWSCFNESTTTAMHSILQNSSLIKKVFIPKFIFPLARVLSAFVNMAFSLTAILLVMLFTGAKLYWTLLLFWMPLVLLFLFCCGMGLILSALAVYFRDVTHLYGVVTLAWMYATPIFYDPAILPETVRGVLSVNPIYHYLTMFRQLIVYGQIPGWETWAVCAGCSALLLTAGWLLFGRLQRNFILHI